MRFLTRQAKNVAKLVQTSSPDTLLFDLAEQGMSNESLIHGIHVYPLGGLKKSSAWFAAVGDGNYNLDRDKKELKLLESVG